MICGYLIKKRGSVRLTFEKSDNHLGLAKRFYKSLKITSSRLVKKDVSGRKKTSQVTLHLAFFTKISKKIYTPIQKRGCVSPWCRGFGLRFGFTTDTIHWKHTIFNYE